MGLLNIFENAALAMLASRSRYEMDGFLKAHGVLLSAALQEIGADSDTAISFFK